jgi:SAM-dependent methyltransferase
MQLIDRFLQAWRCRMARPWIQNGDRVLDIGCHQGEFLEQLGDSIGPSVGLDPLAVPAEKERFSVRAEVLGNPSPFTGDSFDAVLMLATLEHIHLKEPLAHECSRLLRPGGRLIITVPSPIVDHIIHTLVRLRLADGMSLDEHHGFEPRTTPDIFGKAGFMLVHARRFQLGLNYLYVLQKPNVN